MKLLTRNPATAPATALMSAEDRPISFTRDFQPMLSNACFRDRGPDEMQRKGSPAHSSRLRGGIDERAVENRIKGGTKHSTRRSRGSSSAQRAEMPESGNAIA